MKRIKRRKLKSVLFAAVLAAVMCLNAVTAYASVSFTQDSTRLTDATITIAGNPDFYPYEYYDAKTGTYKGVFPEMYELIYQETGTKFQYINTGNSNVQLISAKEGEADIVSAYLLNEKEAANYGLKDAIPVVEYEIDGEDVSICIIFSKSAKQKVVQEVMEGFSTIDGGQITELIAAEESKGRVRKIKIFFILSILLLVAALGGMIFLMTRFIDSVKKEEERNRVDEYRDRLTGVGNLSYFEREFKKIGGDRYKAAYVIAYVGFDITSINKKYGDEASEKQLCYAAGQLTAAGRETDIIARISGGAFGILHACSSQSEAQRWAEQIYRRLNLYNNQFGKNYSAPFRCGVYRIGTGRWNFDIALKNARRCYEIAVNRNQDCFVYDSEMEKQDLIDQLLSHEAAAAIAGPQFRQYLQPVIDARTGRICGAEGLARWDHPELGLLLPGRFIQLMINEGKITDLDMRMFEETCSRLAEWKKEGKSYSLSVNFSRTSLASRDFIQRIRLIASRYFFSRRKLIIEITGESVAEDRNTVCENMQTLKDMGFTIALDGLGRDYSFFSDFKDYPLDIVKLDREMLLDAQGGKGTMLMKGIIRICRMMGTKVVCEGIETRKQFDLVKSMGCDFIQGFYFYNVQSPEEIQKVMQ